MNRIRLEDQPSKLRENLKGSVMKLIPATMTNIDECWDILLGIYGDPYRVMASRKSKIKALHSGTAVLVFQNPTSLSIKVDEIE